MTRRSPHAACLLSRAFALLATTGLLASSCASSEADGYEVADRILALADQSDPAVSSELAAEQMLGPSCLLEVREDEYGMTFEVCVPTGDDPSPDASPEPEAEAERPQLIDDEPLPTPTAQTVLLPSGRFDELVALLPEGSAADALTELADALTEMDDACSTSPEVWASSLPLVGEKMSAAVTHVRALVDYRESPEAKELARSLVERVALQSGCVGAAASEGAVGGMDSSALVAASAVTTAKVEPLYQALWGDGKSPFFYHPDEFAHRRWMRTEGSADLVVAGTSQALLGIEPDLIAEQVGLKVGSVALPGAVAEVQQYWLPEVVAAIAPRIILWGIGPLDFVSACEPDGRAEEFRRLSILKADVLFPFSWAAEVEPIDRLLGDPGANYHAETPTALTAAPRFPNPLGDAFEFAQTDPNEMATSLERFRRAFERGDLCNDRRTLMGKVIAELEAAGSRVIIFGMPLSPELAATYAGGSEALHALVDSAAEEVFIPAGADYVGMMTSISRPGGEFWFDVVHPTRAGGVTLSAELGAALLEAGIS